MMPLQTFVYFLGASMALTIAPGPDNLFVLSQGMSRGRRAAVITAWGMCSGITVHTLAAALGISAIFYSLPTVFQIVKYAGAAYLFYLAFTTVMERTAPTEALSTGGISSLTHYSRGFIMNVLNPKVAMFFLAFLPQFTVSTGNVALQMILLGAVFMLQAFVIFTAVGVFSGTLGNSLLRHPKISARFRWVSASILMSLGLRLAFAG